MVLQLPKRQATSCMYKFYFIWAPDRDQWCTARKYSWPASFQHLCKWPPRCSAKMQFTVLCRRYKTPVSFKVEDKINAITNMNEDLLSMRNWCFNNYLLLNPDKPKLMVFGSREMLPKLRDFTLSLLGKELVPVQAAKDLGVTLDPHLTFNDHIVNTVSSCMSRLRQINRVKHAFDRGTLITVINALVFSKLFYCSNVWANCSNCNTDKLQSVQNFACRIVSGARKFDHVTPILKELEWLPVSSQLYYRSATLAFKCMTGCAPNYLTSIFIKRADISTRARVCVCVRACVRVCVCVSTRSIALRIPTAHDFCVISARVCKT